MQNGRCPVHGGKTPSGAGWHKLQLPTKSETRGLEKFEKKRAAKEKRAKGKARRLAAMSPAERERHEAWHASHAPGSMSGRALRRQQRDTFSWLNKLAADREKLAASEQNVSSDNEVDIFQ